MRLGVVPGEAAAGHDRAGGLRRGGRLRAPPPPLRGQQQVPRQAGGGRARLLGHLARRPPGRVRRAARVTRSSSAPRPTPSSRAAPTGRTRCSRRSCGRPRTGPRAVCRACRCRSTPVPASAAVTDDAPGSGSSAPSRRSTPGSCQRRRGARARAPTARSSTGTSSTTRARSWWCRSIDDGSAILVRQYRVAAGRELLEVPAGKRDVEGEPPAGPRAASSRRRSGTHAGRLVKLVRVLQLARLLRRVHLPVPRAPSSRSTRPRRGRARRRRAMTIERVAARRRRRADRDARARRRQEHHRAPPRPPPPRRHTRDRRPRRVRPRRARRRSTSCSPSTRRG